MPGYEVEPQVLSPEPPALSYLQRHYPKYLLIDLSEEVALLQANTLIGMRNDYVELAELACRIYSSISEFFSIDDEVFDTYDVDSFKQAFSQLYPTCTDVEEHYELYKQAVCLYIRSIMDKLVLYQVPAFDTTGSVYLPDGFIYGNKTMLFKLELEDR